jgi:GTPase SAR1 family protein
LRLQDDYAEALSKGTVPGAYVRLMFLGAGGSGKSSLLDGLMNVPLRMAETTAVADTRTVSFQWIKAADSCEEAWKEHTSSDEATSLAAHSHSLALNKMRGKEEVGSFIFCWPLAPAVVSFGLAAGAVAYIEHEVSGKQVSREHREKISETARTAYSEIIKGAKQHSAQLQGKHNPDVVMHIWDCGGQPVFLDILAAFLTPRTMFLLLFDASSNLEEMYQEKWHHNGKPIMGREQNITHLQLLIQWLQLIHCSLIEKNEHLLRQASPSSNIIPKFPRAMLVGSRKDQITQEEVEGVKSQLQSACDYASFSKIIVDKLLVDNTKAGKGKEEDPGYKKIRENINVFAKSLVVDTPLAWVTFRQVLQKVAEDKPILLYSEVVFIAEQCHIPTEVVPSVLQFYHQLGALLHYANVPSLATTIIVEPQWLINQLRLLLMPDWFGHRPQHLKQFWKWFEERGVVVEGLYQELWKDCQLEGGPQALVDVLLHFDLATEIKNECPDDMISSRGRKYFMPCVLKVKPKSESTENSEPPPSKPIREAATLYMCFSTGYVPPGFFVRLVAHMSNQEGYTPLLDREVYRNSILFKCRDIDRIIVSESLESISVRFFRVAERNRHNIRFAESCILLQRELVSMCKNVHDWMTCVTSNLAFPCTCSQSAPRHFVVLEPGVSCESNLFCAHDNEYELSPQQRFWLPFPSEIPVHSPVEDGSLTETEMKLVAKEIENGLSDVVEEMEMQYTLQKIARAPSRSREQAYAVISDFVEGEGGTRYELAQLLDNAGFDELSRKLLKGQLIQGSQQSADPLRETPTLPQLIAFPKLNGSEINVLKKIGARYNVFGIFLLNDDDGSVTDALQKKYMRDSDAINLEISKKWLQGEGKLPMTWVTFLRVLKNIDMKPLAFDIEASLRGKSSPQGRH